MAEATKVERAACAACHKKKALLAADGAQNFIKAPNQGRICLQCVNQRDEEEMRTKGRITCILRFEKGEWWGVSRGGKYVFKLNRAPGQNDGQVVGAPSFTDKEENLWRGRFYSTSGSVHFQKVKATKEKATKVMPPARRGRKKEAVASA